MPQLIVFAGPNGSGKSTFISQLAAGTRELEFALPQRVINPDEFARAINPLAPDTVEIQAGRAVLAHRAALIEARLDFAIETTLSGHGELRLFREARDAGYEIGLVFIATSEPTTNLIRIERRREEQNRSVSSPAVLRRYARSLSRVAEAVTLTDLAFIYDNSGAEFVEILRFRNGRDIWRAPQIPRWAGRAFACSCLLGEEPL